MLLKQECYFFSLEHVESSKSVPLGVRTRALESVVWLIILAPPFRCITLGKLINFKPQYFLLQNEGGAGKANTQLISLGKLSEVI